MGVWTSPFMIGFTLVFNLLIRLAFPKDFPINLGGVNAYYRTVFR
jgi:hypothetical protein